MAWERAEVEVRDRDAAQDGAALARDRLAFFRAELYSCFTARADALFELADAVLRWPDGRIRLAVDVSNWPRLGPEDDETQVTAAQVREVVARLMQAGQWQPGDKDILPVIEGTLVRR